MSIQSLEVTRLTSNEGVAAFVKARVTRLVAPDKQAFPFIIVMEAKGDSDITQDGASGLIDVEVQIHCWGEDGEGLEDLVTAVRDCVLTDEAIDSEFTLSSAYSAASFDLDYEGPLRIFGRGIAAKYWVQCQ